MANDHIYTDDNQQQFKNYSVFVVIILFYYILSSFLENCLIQISIQNSPIPQCPLT